ncbi:bifunctional isocitrate dehydrogenase kinase/phosphatase [Paraferrimonas sedimenticola]|uniref:Isocitrate dehydrogenase kinase/phosphatase n=1 Tax=Paraferrimonas sedimenticola TaxID=375674 RepID=A0AA37VZE6_9GAMM|nr:bifunctional isocitrate dehydrogenase kinase/phosphatase [Paraferrimonas sedimenticola]GLP97164.1 isocitrate dehydrogenase kinase/phosphatase [Paraferrimonas sedimenticola]
MSQSQANRVAYRILIGFEQHFRRFMRITGQASTRFYLGQWNATAQAQRDRINQYSRIVDETASDLITKLDAPVIVADLWRDTKHAYSHLLEQHPQAELAQTFFNSTFARLFRHQGFNSQYLYLNDAPPQCPIADASQYLQIGVGPNLKRDLRQFVYRQGWPKSLCDFEQALSSTADELLRLGLEDEYSELKLIKSGFYRNKGGYLIGALKCGGRRLPIALAFVNRDNKVALDALITGEDALSLVFSFARSYFMVTCDKPAQLVGALKNLMPNKSIAELYSAIGFQKHGKSELYRDFINHMNASDEQLVAAEGIKGMVMTVFTLPSYPVVFKVIKDKFAPPKDANKQLVIDKYALVKRHDRVGRMADTHRFTQLQLPKARFHPELLEELRQTAPSEVEIIEDSVIIHHCYLERRLTPLNIFIEHADTQALDRAIDDYGQALKDMISANIFPGDMLYKNFGISRHGRVIFYDYDEVSYLDECNFRKIPPPRFPEDEWAAEPWYSVAPNDVFPEEFASFLLTIPKVRKAFLRRHKDLLSADYWQAQQAAIAEGEQADVYPYPPECRIPPN